MKYLLTLVLLVLATLLTAQYNIKIHTVNFDEKSLIVSYPKGNQTVFLDTIEGDSSGVFVFKGNKDLEAGVYFVGKSRNKQLHKLIIKPDEDKFEVYYDFKHRLKTKFIGSKENTIYNNYLALVDEYRLQANILSRGNHKVKLDSIHRLMNNLRLKIISANPETLAAVLIKSELDWVDPVFNDADKKENEKKILDYKLNHYLDNLDLSNPVTFRLPVSHKEIIRYFDKIVHSKPSVVNSTIDNLLRDMGFNSEMYKYYLPFFLNRYNRSYKGWFDEVYVHIAREYYNKEKAPWIPPSTHEFVQYQADNKENTLIGKIIPDIVFVDQKGDSVRLIDIEAKYLVLVFWRPGCSHCRHAMPILNDMLKKYRKYGVKLVTVCTRQRSDTYRCWDGVKSEKMEAFDYNLADKSGKTGFLRKFNVGGIPMIYALDKDKRIIDKNIKAGNLIKRLKEIIKR